MGPRIMTLFTDISGDQRPVDKTRTVVGVSDTSALADAFMHTRCGQLGEARRTVGRAALVVTIQLVKSTGRSPLAQTVAHRPRARQPARALEQLETWPCSVWELGQTSR